MGWGCFTWISWSDLSCMIKSICSAATSQAWTDLTPRAVGICWSRTLSSASVLSLEKRKPPDNKLLREAERGDITSLRMFKLEDYINDWFLNAKSKYPAVTTRNSISGWNVLMSVCTLMCAAQLLNAHFFGELMIESNLRNRRRQD